jgi:hypothetical protein
LNKAKNAANFLPSPAICWTVIMTILREWSSLTTGTHGGLSFPDTLAIAIQQLFHNIKSQRHLNILPAMKVALSN